jgi:hypothetical protein
MDQVLLAGESLSMLNQEVIMFPTSALVTLLSFARGQTPWGKPVFDALIEVVVYFGQTFVPAADVAGAVAEETTDDDAITAIESVIAGSEDEGHPIASVSPFVVGIILKFALQILLKKISG